MFDCGSSITCYTNRRLFFFSKRKECVKYKWPICGLFRTLSSSLLLQSINRLSESFGKIPWSLLDSIVASSHSFLPKLNVYISQSRILGLKRASGHLQVPFQELVSQHCLLPHFHEYPRLEWVAESRCWWWWRSCRCPLLFFLYFFLLTTKAWV